MSTITSAPGKTVSIARITTRVLVSLLFVVVSIPKLIQLDFMMANMAEINFGTLSTIVIGAIELLAVILLWLPKWRTLALCVLLLIMAGSAGAHWGFGHPPTEVIPSFVVALLVFVTLWLDRGAALWRFVLSPQGRVA